jgi:hypothetical protein
VQDQLTQSRRLHAYGTVSAISGSSTYFSAIDLMLSDLAPWGTLRLCFDSACS